MKIKAFFKLLSIMYSPYFSKKGKRKNEFLVKYYCQVNTFSYEIYHHKQAFTGRAEYTSKVFSFWNNSNKRAIIMLDISSNLLRLKKESKE